METGNTQRADSKSHRIQAIMNYVLGFMVTLNTAVLVFMYLNPRSSTMSEGRHISRPGSVPIDGFEPEGGLVPTSETAISVAVAIWSPIYGSKEIASEKPFHAELVNEIWTVCGSLPKPMAGGTAVIKIAKKDGRILYVNHGK